jgi:hypothetical protein
LSRGFLEASTIAELPDRMIRQVTDECEAALEELFEGMNVLALRQLRLVTGVTFPSVEQWNEGERWFSCEASLRKWGSPLAQPEWQSLPSPLSKLADDVAARPMEYRLCVETPLNSILPMAAQGVVADCTTARWALKPVSLGVTFGEIYPGAVKAKALASERCRATNTGALAVSTPLVTKFEWQTPHASAMCWVSITPDPVASPTPTPEPETPTPAPRRIVPVEPEVPTEPEVPVETEIPVEPTTDPTTPTEPPV